jgi:hypothetical protein
MRAKLIIITLIALVFNIPCQSQTKQHSAFTSVIKLFPEEKIPSKYKDGIIGGDIKKINKRDAIKYFHFTEEDLKMNDFGYDMDEDIKYDNWVEVLPGALGKITKENYVALVYALLKSPAIDVETYKVWITTYTYDGQIIDSIIVRSQYTQEIDWRDVVFLEKNLFRIFDYKPNLENYKTEELKRGIYDVIDKEGPETVVEINDYHIDESGKIKHIKTHPKRYVKEFVSFYRSYHKDSDDPMNEYNFE